jgi:APA family basic amino acid/polyamine antiporter
VLPILSVLASFYLMLNLPSSTWLRFVVWMVVGFVVYFLYGYGHSRLGRGYAGETRRPEQSRSG